MESTAGGALGFGGRAAALGYAGRGERGRVGGGGSSYRRPGSPGRAGPREEARARGGRDAAAAHGRVRLGVWPEVEDDHRAPPVGGSGRSRARAALEKWYWVVLGCKEKKLGCAEGLGQKRRSKKEGKEIL
jgi:hypothetical protein